MHRKAYVVVAKEERNQEIYREASKETNEQQKEGKWINWKGQIINIDNGINIDINIQSPTPFY